MMWVIVTKELGARQINEYYGRLPHWKHYNFSTNYWRTMSLFNDNGCIERGWILVGRVEVDFQYFCFVSVGYLFECLCNCSIRLLLFCMLIVHCSVISWMSPFVILQAQKLRYVIVDFFVVVQNLHASLKLFVWNWLLLLLTVSQRKYC